MNVKKKEAAIGENRCHFSSSSIRGTQKLYLRKRILKDLHKFFKFNLCYYNILKIKNILIIKINLSFS